jgi:hypothetical protein
MYEYYNRTTRGTGNMIEKCGCEEALYYKKMARKLANAIMRYATHEDQENYGNVYLAEKIVPIADDIIKTPVNQE